ncbi:hypothetical protein K0U83_04490 [bacterium]|nr:hypothetical protein [bacterium]
MARVVPAASFNTDPDTLMPVTLRTTHPVCDARLNDFRVRLRAMIEGAEYVEQWANDLAFADVGNRAQTVREFYERLLNSFMSVATPENSGKFMANIVRDHAWNVSLKTATADAIRMFTRCDPMLLEDDILRVIAFRREFADLRRHYDNQA